MGLPFKHNSDKMVPSSRARGTLDNRFSAASRCCSLAKPPRDSGSSWIRLRAMISLVKEQSPPSDFGNSVRPFSARSSSSSAFGNSEPKVSTDSLGPIWFPFSCRILSLPSGNNCEGNSRSLFLERSSFLRLASWLNADGNSESEFCPHDRFSKPAHTPIVSGSTLRVFPFKSTVRMLAASASAAAGGSAFRLHSRRASTPVFFA
mmetsp:Transcript_23377/g.66620  ORF Transcript_23377/g.66620 Transcript_23377/m.66620 type:complete len:205 (+) Transcript_23377:305-919(+)